MRVLTTLGLALLIGTVALSGTAGAAPRASSASVVKVAALASGLAFDKKVLHARHGRVTIVFTNRSMLRHDVRIERGTTQLGGTKVIGKGRTRAALTLKKGRYTFYCSVPGHEDAGMKGTLVVS